MNTKKLVVFIATIIIVLWSPRWADGQVSGTESAWVQGGEYRLKISTFRSDEISDHPILVVALHGDAPFHNPDYQNTFARKIAKKTRNVIAVGLLRPGYTDPEGNTSDGERGEANGDNWNARNTDSIAGAIHKLKDRYQSSKVVVAGHLGGAAITANILGRHPELIDSALLVSCPCEVKRWRENMFELTCKKVFKGKINTLSPIGQIEGISDKVDITMIVGSDDRVAPPYLSKSYRKKALELSKDISLIQLKGKGHEIFLDPKVFAELATMIQLID